VADVGRADERPIEVYAFDQTIGSQNFERVPLGRDHRRVVTDIYNYKFGRAGKARANPFN
jgi:hypothetical protein